MKLTRLMFLLVLMSFFLYSCNHYIQCKIAEIMASGRNAQMTSVLIENYYQYKHIQLIQEDECDEDENVYEMPIQEAIIESKIIEGKSLSAVFSFAGNCCSDYRGDYTISDQTITFSMILLNDDVCDCLCVYRYELQIKDLPDQVNNLEIKFQ